MDVFEVPQHHAPALGLEDVEWKVRIPTLSQKTREGWGTQRRLNYNRMMSKVRVAAFSVSLDGFGAGLRQDLQNPLGVRGTELHGWFFQTEIFKKILGESGGGAGIDNDVAEQSFQNVGAWILGRNMFGPVRGPWKDDSWKGWWGDIPPFHTPVFVLTHHPRASLEME